VTITAGTAAICAWNGVDFIQIGAGLINLVTGVTGTLPVANGGTGLTAGTSGGVPYYSSTSAITSSALLTSNALVVGGGAGAAPTALGSLGTTTTVLHGNPSGAPTFGAVSLTTDVSGVLPTANGGTGGTLPVANGGTGSTTLTANNVLLGNGTSALQAVAPGTSGNVLTSNGTTWASTAPSGVTLGTAVTCVSQSNIDYTSLPSGLKRITVAFNEVACGGNILIQLGTSSGFETTGYVSTSTQLDNAGASSAISSTTGICSQGGNPNLSGVYVICSLGSNIWSASMVAKADTIRTAQSGGAKTLGGTLDRIRITTTNGTTYTSGTVNILYE